MRLVERGPHRASICSRYTEEKRRRELRPRNRTERKVRLSGLTERALSWVAL